MELVQAHLLVYLADLEVEVVLLLQLADLAPLVKVMLEVQVHQQLIMAVEVAEVLAQWGVMDQALLVVQAVQELLQVLQELQLSMQRVVAVLFML
jgi:hypothetical protein